MVNMKEVEGNMKNQNDQKNLKNIDLNLFKKLFMTLIRILLFKIILEYVILSFYH